MQCKKRESETRRLVSAGSTGVRGIEVDRAQEHCLVRAEKRTLEQLTSVRMRHRENDERLHQVRKID